MRNTVILKAHQFLDPDPMNGCLALTQLEWWCDCIQRGACISTFHTPGERRSIEQLFIAASEVLRELS